MPPNNPYMRPVPPDFLRDESRKIGTALAIAFPSNTQELRQALAYAHRDNLPVTVQGGRTGIAAGAVPDGGVIINLSRMDKISEVQNLPDGHGLLRVESGLTLTALNRYLANQHLPLRFTPDPTETSATLGGMAACNASGARSFAHGAIRHHINALTVVLADGAILQLARGRERAQGEHFKLVTHGGQVVSGQLPHLPLPQVKSAAGYRCQPDMDLLDLFIGSEGTLGIITELELKLLPKPDQTLGILCYFSNDLDALACVDLLRRQHHQAAPTTLAAIEFFDQGTLRLIRTTAPHTALKLPMAKPHWQVALYIEWEINGGTSEPLEFTQTTLQATGGHAADTWMATTPQTVDKLKLFRHAVPERVNAIIAQRKQHYPNLTKLGTDLSVPDAHLQDIFTTYQRDLNAHQLEYVIFGHIGNNHLHVNILPRNMQEYAAGKELYHSWAKLAVAWGGSVSAEHGIGCLKKELLALMYGRTGIEAMRQLKHLFDPHARLNPGRLF